MEEEAGKKMSEEETFNSISTAKEILLIFAKKNLQINLMILLTGFQDSIMILKEL